jgi:hypothetical protein
VSSLLDFDALQLSLMNWGRFVQRYKGVIRADIVWDKISKPTMGLVLLTTGAKVDIVWYMKGDWRDGKPRTISVGENTAIIRVPAVKKRDGQLLLLDGCHRLTELKPAVVIVDWFQPNSKDRVYITDLFNRWN